MLFCKIFGINEREVYVSFPINSKNVVGNAGQLTVLFFIKSYTFHQIGGITATI
jgi:hypothetical protein